MRPVVAFDADVLIYAATPTHRWRGPVRKVLTPLGSVCVGSVLLLPEVLSKPRRLAPGGVEDRALTALLARLELRPVDEATAGLGVAYGAEYGLRAADAIHLATAVAAGGDQFLTNNRKDFPKDIPEIEVVYPDDLPA